MTTPATNKEEQRGKRRSAAFTEFTLFLVICAALYGATNALPVLSLILVPGLAYAASLRGLDAYFKRV